MEQANISKNIALNMVYQVLRPQSIGVIYVKITTTVITIRPVLLVEVEALSNKYNV